VVIALAHTDRLEDRALIAARDVDVLLSGDDHDLFIRYDGRVAAVESGSQASFVAIVTLDIETVEGRGGPSVGWRPALEVIDTAGVAPDPAVAKAVAGYEAFLSAALDIEIAATPVRLDTRRTTVRSRESAFANMIADAMRASTKADAAIVNGGGIRGDKVYEAGTVITRRDVLTELPFGNKTVVLEVAGTDILAALEHGLSGLEHGAGRFPHVSGMRVTFDPARPAGV